MLQVKSGLLIASLHPLPDGTRSTIFNGQAISACAARLATRNRAVSSRKSGVPIAQRSLLTPDPKKNRFINRNLSIGLWWSLLDLAFLVGDKFLVVNYLYLISCEGIGIGGFIHSYYYFITGRSTSGSDLRKKTMKKSWRNTEAHQQVLQVVALYDEDQVIPLVVS